MYGADFIHGCISILGLLATIAIIVIALGTILRFVEPANAFKYCGIIIGFTIAMVLLVSVLVSLWANMSAWQRVVLAALAFGVWRLRQRPHEPRKKNDGE